MHAAVKSELRRRKEDGTLRADDTVGGLAHLLLAAVGDARLVEEGFLWHNVRFPRDELFQHLYAKCRSLVPLRAAGANVSVKMVLHTPSKLYSYITKSSDGARGESYCKGICILNSSEVCKCKNIDTRAWSHPRTASGLSNYAGFKQIQHNNSSMGIPSHCLRAPSSCLS